MAQARMSELMKDYKGDFRIAKKHRRSKVTNQVSIGED